MPTVYVAGHRNPDTDSIASAIGYAELKGRLDPRNRYLAVRLGDCNPQTRWVLERSGAPEPVLLPHIMLRACDVMRTDFPVVDHRESIRRAGLAMLSADLAVVPVVDDEGVLVGVVTERTLARRFIRESRGTSTLKDAPTRLKDVVEVLEGELVSGEDSELQGRVWVHAIEDSSPTGMMQGDVVVVGNRTEVQRLAIEHEVAAIIVSNGMRPSPSILQLARDHSTAVVVSPLDSYVSARMITLASPCRALMEDDPLTVPTDYLLADISEQIKDVHYGAAVAVDGEHRPVGLITRAELVAPPRRRVLLVDHAEEGQAVLGIDQAEIVEILDHHHIGSIETRVPVTAVFDPVGSTATLVVERFRNNGMEPSRSSAVMLLGAILSDTVILNSPTTTERDHAVVQYLERVLALDARQFGREMFEATADVSDEPAAQIIARDAKRYGVRDGQLICIAQVEVVGKGLLERKDELLEAMRRERNDKGLALYALMVTDVFSQGTDLLVAGDTAAVARTFEAEAHDSVIELPGVMSRKKQVAPKLMAAF